MVSKYHKNVQKGLIGFGQESRKYKKICMGNKLPIHIHHPTKKRTILYRPDVYFKTKHGKKYIFEILDSELKDRNLVTADIIYSILSPNVSKIFFIIPTSDEKEISSLFELIEVIFGTLSELGINLEEIPRFAAVYDILKSEARNPEEVKKMLKKLSKKDKW